MSSLQSLVLLLPLFGCVRPNLTYDDRFATTSGDDCPESLGASDAELLARRFAGVYVVTGDELELAGFAQLTLNLDNTYAQSGRTDTQGPTGSYASPAELALPADEGEVPPDVGGPFLRLVNDPDGEGEWVFGRVAKHAGTPTTLSLTLYAERRGQGLRWTAPYTLHLVERP